MSLLKLEKIELRPLPAGWRLVRLGEICEEKTGIRDPRSEPDKLFQYVDITSVDAVTKKIIAPKALLGAVAPSRARQVIRTGDVLVATTRPNLNAVALVPPELHDQICSTGFCVLRSKDGLDSEYLFAFVQSTEFIQSLSDLVRGALYPAVTDKQVRAQLIPLPPPEQQQRIAAILHEQLADVERARAATEAQLDGANVLPAAYLRSVFDSLEAKQWPRKRLGDFCRLVNGDSYRETDWSALGVPIIRIQNLNDSSKPFNYWSGPLDSRVRVKAGDVLLAWSGTPGTSFGAHIWTRGEAVLNQHIFRVDLNVAQIDPQWAVVAINEQLSIMIGKAHGGVGLRHVTKREVENLTIAFPPLLDQRCIAAVLNEQMAAAGRLRQTLTAQLDAINRLPATLLRRAFRGEL